MSVLRSDNGVFGIAWCFGSLVRNAAELGDKVLRLWGRLFWFPGPEGGRRGKGGKGMDIVDSILCDFIVREICFDSGDGVEVS